MRICHINLARGFRGGERQTLYLMEGLRKLGCVCKLFARHKGGLAEAARREDLPVYGLSKPYFISAFKLRGYDVIHAHEAKAHQLAAITRRVHKRPFIVTRRVARVPKRNRFTVARYTAAAHTVAVSHTIADILVDWGLKRECLSVIYDAVRLEDCSDLARVTELRRRFEGYQVVGSVGALTIKDKDPVTFLEAARHVQDQRNNVAFVLIGGGKDEGAVRAKARELGLKNVFFEGHQADPYSYYSVMDLLVLTSKSEGLGSAILDAFAYRVPVVATATGGIGELIQDGHTGYLAPVGDARAVATKILEALGERARRNDYVDNALSLLKSRHTIDMMASHYAKLYQELVEGDYAEPC
ncbi:MAG: glycosyltransferase [Gammaproteobacteria bacterium]|nr:glycosyltransferase [Gammaproteobacteria bacterium]